jgi:hypothetical protein
VCDNAAAIFNSFLRLVEHRVRCAFGIGDNDALLHVDSEDAGDDGQGRKQEREDSHGRDVDRREYRCRRWQFPQVSVYGLPVAFV